MNELIGKVIDNYEIQEIVGQGGMGVVYRAYHPELQRYAAVKVMRPELVELEGSYERFLQEARTAAHLDHPGIVNVLNFGRISGDPDSYYLMMDYIEGPSLRQLIVDDPNGMQISDVAHIFRQIADVLTFAHEQGVLHRDMKPDNILLTESKEEGEPFKAIVTDFGLVKIAYGSIAKTQEGVSLGTPAYMSPEQCRGGEVDARTDIYALGVMLYEALTGKRPYPIRNLFDAVKFHSSGNFVAPRAHVPSIPIQLNILVRQMMSPDPSKRPENAQIVYDKLIKILEKRSDSDVNESQIGEKITSGIYSTPAANTLEDALDDDFHDTGRETTSQLAQMCVIVTYKDEVERIYSLRPQGKSMVVGRQPGAEIVLNRPERYVSKRHCEIFMRDDQVYVRDIGSTNGTYLGQQRLDPRTEYEWDQETDINLGSFKLSLRPQGQEDYTPVPTANDETIVHGHFSLVCPDGIPDRVAVSDAPIIIGRVPGCDMVLNNTRVSKRHCRIERAGNLVTVMDLNSTNGTYLREQRLPANDAVTWNGTDPLRIGSYILRLDI